ncbi:protein-L-isoaspartate(D-aspartate) O-methyltransferase [Parapedobacter indicus]|uniref:Protein-L-isoaspartate O-methyltransferase n=2 Tax=Parapedobacter indicus TaxID=1477437 RepID=A0A1I3TR19_9SPHI|nr:protein-L-isoaspartate(D-aspartate) O-methyltransferase [Parapedobacter indicus]SFJ73050.1 protein-L-isoaspartate(D-aspartate) O-methyltransferase [Parapedobacter indicus]
MTVTTSSYLLVPRAHWGNYTNSYPMQMKSLILSLLVFLILQPVVAQRYDALRNSMVRTQLETRGINHSATLEAMRKVERHLFVPATYQKYAYDDGPLPIGYHQTISQPYIVAYMTQLLAPKAGDRVLEIGTGSGYQAAILAEIVKEVYTIEIVNELGERTKKLLDKLGYDNVHVIIGDGHKGLHTKAPFDAIIVTAAPEEIPQPLIDQLKDGGRMVIPVGPEASTQTLMLIEKRDGGITKTNLTPVRFVPFTRKKESGSNL